MTTMILKPKSVWYAVLMLFILIPIISDQVNGFLQFRMGFTISISQYIKSLYTVFLLGFSFIYCFLYLKTSALISVLLIVFLGINIFLSQLINPHRSSDLAVDIIFFSKILTFPISYVFFSHLQKTKTVAFNVVYQHSYLILSIILFCAIILSLLGFGNLNYGVGDGDIEMGYRGFFIAGNEVGALFILLYSFWFFHVLSNGYPFWKFFGATLVGMIVAGLIVSKTTMGSFLIITLFTPLLLKIKTGNLFSFSIYDRKMVMLLFVLVIISTTVLYVVFQDRIVANIERIQFNIERADSFNGFLLSGRNDRFADSWRLFNEYNTVEKVIGTGWSYPQAVITEQYLGDGSAEVDYLDILVSYGLLGFLLIYGFWTLILVKIATALFNTRDLFIVPIAISFVLLFGNSFLSGHIVYSALVGFYLGLFVSKLGLHET